MYIGTDDDSIDFHAGVCWPGGLRTDAWTRCALISANNWRLLTEHLAADEFVEVPATQCICSLCEVSQHLSKICLFVNGITQRNLCLYFHEILLVSPDGVASSRMVGVSASVNLPLHHKVQKFSSGIR